MNALHTVVPIDPGDALVAFFVELESHQSWSASVRLNLTEIFGYQTRVLAY